MSTTSLVDPTNRQILVNLGNRFVTFAPETGLPQANRFDPEQSPDLPRVADESEVAEARIAETLQVSGMNRGAPHPEDADIELVDEDGTRILVEVKVREREPKARELQLGTEEIRRAKARGKHLEIWYFNLERLNLTVMRIENSAPRFDQFVPLNVWEKTPSGIFERRRVVEEVEDWLHRVERLYAQIQEWVSDRGDLRLDATRSVTMSEEMMRNFAVTDRDVPVLDIVRGDHVVASFVPRGLWLIGAWGRIDVITKNMTSILIAIKKVDGFEWKLTSLDDRRRTIDFDKDALLELLTD
jgi:hypothetical protein